MASPTYITVRRTKGPPHAGSPARRAKLLLMTKLSTVTTALELADETERKKGLATLVLEWKPEDFLTTSKIGLTERVQTRND